MLVFHKWLLNVQGHGLNRLGFSAVFMRVTSPVGMSGL